MARREIGRVDGIKQREIFHSFIQSLAKLNTITAVLYYLSFIFFYFVTVIMGLMMVLAFI